MKSARPEVTRALYKQTTEKILSADCLHWLETGKMHL